MVSWKLVIGAAFLAMGMCLSTSTFMDPPFSFAIDTLTVFSDSTADCTLQFPVDSTQNLLRVCVPGQLRDWKHIHVFGNGVSVRSVSKAADDKMIAARAKLTNMEFYIRSLQDMVRQRSYPIDKSKPHEGLQKIIQKIAEVEEDVRSLREKLKLAENRVCLSINFHCSLPTCDSIFVRSVLRGVSWNPAYELNIQATDGLEHELHTKLDVYGNVKLPISAHVGKTILSSLPGHATSKMSRLQERRIGTPPTPVPVFSFVDHMKMGGVPSMMAQEDEAVDINSLDVERAAGYVPATSHADEVVGAVIFTLPDQIYYTANEPHSVFLSSFNVSLNPRLLARPLDWHYVGWVSNISVEGNPTLPRGYLVIYINDERTNEASYTGEAVTEYTLLRARCIHFDNHPDLTVTKPPAFLQGTGRSEEHVIEFISTGNDVQCLDLEVGLPLPDSTNIRVSLVAPENVSLDNRNVLTDTVCLHPNEPLLYTIKYHVRYPKGTQATIYNA